MSTESDDPLDAKMSELYQGTGLTEYDSEDRAISKEETWKDKVVPSLAELFYPVYLILFDNREGFIARLEGKLKQANIKYTVEEYMSAGLAIGTLSGAFTGMLLGMLVFALLGLDVVVLPETPYSLIPGSNTEIGRFIISLGSGLKYLLAGLIATGSGAIVGLITAIGGTVMYPRARIYQRRREIRIILPDVIAFMYSLSTGGRDQLEVIHAVANSEETFGEASVEFQRITQEMEFFNEDYQSAVQQVSNTTPSDELSKFLTDMLSIINSGGDMTNFLESQKEYYVQKVQRKQEDQLETLELFGEMYMSLSILPLLLVIVLVIAALLGQPRLGMLMIIVYFLLPIINFVFGVMVSTVKTDEVGSGKLSLGRDKESHVNSQTSLTNLGIVGKYSERKSNPVFSRIKTTEFRYRVGQIFRNPMTFFRQNPPYALMFTLPLTPIVMGAMIMGGIAVPDPGYFLSNSWSQTVAWFFVPLTLNTLPLSFFYEWNARTRGAITNSLTTDLRKLANTNDTGQPLLESFRIVGKNNPTPLGNEFRRIYKKVKFGSSISPVLVEFNNKYRLPRLARTVQLVDKAQEASAQISDVLRVAAEMSENQDEMAEERRSRTMVQVVVVGVSFLVFLGVITLLQSFLINRMVEVLAQTKNTQFGTSVNPDFLELIFFHAVALQGICSGVISGYVQTGKLYSGLKFMLLFMFIATAVWGLVVV